ncbi:phage tail tape measure protein [Paenibacillus sp. LC231]|uniref:phage tail tape measure protein n=1 Tax=Paenibacillus sp. LC231 TaxID=1120679 RepID=UPI0008DDB041|nr:phage tail tape measure protein [Paenibacillus sp. LC231]OIB03504.1 phage tail tape measure protein [Paenibacillus sp. LC231]
MAFDLMGRISIRDDGASKTLRDIEKRIDRAKKASSEFTDTNKMLARAQQSASSASADVKRELSGVERATKNAGKAMDGLNSKVKNVFRSMGASIGKGALFGGIAALGTAAYVGGKSLSKAMDFEAQMSSIEALTGATEKEMAQMNALALRMGANTKYNALEAAQGIEELLKAGIQPATVQAGALEAALNLATAGGLDLASAAEIMSTALNAFQEDGMSAAQAANILAGTANASATSVEELRYSLSMSSAVAAGLGMNFEDVNVALGLFANRGLKGSDAGTSLKTMLQTLQPVTDEQIGLFRELGLMTEDGSNQFFDAAGNIKSLNDIAGTLRKSLSKLTNQERQHALKLMFGTDAVRAATILYKEGAEGVDEFREEMSKVTALDVARKKMDNAAGAVEQFKGALETLQIAGMMPLLPLVKDLANGAADFIEAYGPQLVKGIEGMVAKAKKYLSENFINNPEFQNLPDLQSKIKWIFDSLAEDFNAWYESSGKAKLEKLSAKAVDTIAGALEASESLIDAASTIGTKIGSSLVSNLMAAIKNDPAASAIFYGGAGGMVAGVPGLVVGGTVGASNAVVEKGIDKLGGAVGGWTSEGGWLDSVSDFIFGEDDSKPHNGGLRNVPYNNYQARLHSGEAVLTRSEAERWRGESGANYGAGGGSGNVVITGNTFNVREEADIERIAKRIAYEMAM